MSGVVGWVAAAAAVVGATGATLRHGRTGRKGKQAPKEPTSISANQASADPSSSCLVAIKGAEGFLSCNPQQHEVLWTNLDWDGHQRQFLPFLSPHMLWLQQEHAAKAGSSDMLYSFTPVASAAYSLAALQDVPYALCVGTPTNKRGTSGSSRGLQQLWRMREGTHQLVNGMWPSSSGVEVVPIAAMTVNELASWQQAMQAAVDAKVQKVVLQARSKAQQAKQQHADQQRMLDAAEQEQQRLAAELAATTLARDAALQDVVQRDEEICGLLLKITKQDAALKAIQGRMQLLMPSADDGTDAWAESEAEGGSPDPAMTMLASSLQSADLDRLKLRLLQLRVEEEEQDGDDSGDLGLQDGGLSPAGAAASMEHSYTLLTRPLRASRSQTQPGASNSAAHGWSPADEAMSRPDRTSSAATGKPDGSCTDGGVDDAVEQVVAALRTQQQRRIPLAAEVQHLMESSEWHARLQEHLWVTQPHSQLQYSTSQPGGQAAAIYQSWSWGATGAGAGSASAGGAGTTSMMSRQVSMPAAIPAPQSSTRPQEPSSEHKACGAATEGASAQDVNSAGVGISTAGCAGGSTTPAHRQSSPGGWPAATGSSPTPQRCADEYQVPLRRRTSPGTWATTKAAGDATSHAGAPPSSAAQQHSAQPAVQEPVLLPACSPRLSGVMSRSPADTAVPSHALASYRTTTASEAGVPAAHALVSYPASEAGAALPSHALASYRTTTASEAGMSDTGALPSYALASYRTTQGSEAGSDTSAAVPVDRAPSIKQMASSFEQLLQQQHQQVQQQQAGSRPRRLSTTSTHSTGLTTSGGRAAARAAAASRHTPSPAASTAPEASATLAPRTGSTWGRQHGAPGARTPPSRGTSGPLESLDPAPADTRTPLHRGVSSPLDSGLQTLPVAAVTAPECSAHSLGSSASDDTSCSAESTPYNFQDRLYRDHASSTVNTAGGQQPPSPVVPLPLHQLTRHVGAHRRQDSLGQYTCRTVGSTCMPNLGSTRVMESSRTHMDTWRALDTPHHIPSSRSNTATPRDFSSPAAAAVSSSPLQEQGSEELGSLREEETRTTEQSTDCGSVSLANARASSATQQLATSAAVDPTSTAEQPTASDSSPVASMTAAAAAAHKDFLGHGSRLLKLYKHSDWGSGVMTDGTSTSSPAAKDPAAGAYSTSPAPALQPSHSPSSSLDSPAQLLPLPPSHAASLQPSPQQTRHAASAAPSTASSIPLPVAQRGSTGVWRPAAGSIRKPGLETEARAQAMKNLASFPTSPATAPAVPKDPHTLLLATTDPSAPGTKAATAGAMASTAGQSFPTRPSLYLDVRPALDQGRQGALQCSRAPSTGISRHTDGGASVGGDPAGELQEVEGYDDGDEEDMGAVSPASGLLPPSMLFQHVVTLRSAGKRTLVQQQDSDEEEEVEEETVGRQGGGQQLGGMGHQPATACEISAQRDEHEERQQLGNRAGPHTAAGRKAPWKQRHGALPRSAFSTPTHAAQQRQPKSQQHDPDAALSAAIRSPVPSPGDTCAIAVSSLCGTAGPCGTAVQPSISPPSAQNMVTHQALNPQAGAADTGHSAACSTHELVPPADTVGTGSAETRSGNGTAARAWLAAASAKASAASTDLPSQNGAADDGRLAGADMGGDAEAHLTTMASQLCHASMGSESLASSVTLHVAGKPSRRNGRAADNLQDSLTSPPLCSGAPAAAGVVDV